jgi:hypothetical protein
LDLSLEARDSWVESASTNAQAAFVTWTRTPSLTSLAGLFALALSCAGPVHQARPYRHERRPANTFVTGSTRPIGYAPGLIVVDGIPPAPLYEEIPGAPFEDAYWVSGYWDWNGYDWVWIPGHWEVAPLGYVWVGPSYNNYGSYCEYTGGYWEREQEAPPPPQPVEIPATAGVRPARRPKPPQARVREPGLLAPSYTSQPTPRRVDPQPAAAPDTGRLDPTVAPPSRPLAKPSARPQPYDFEAAPSRARIAPESRPVARPGPTPRSSFAPSRAQQRPPAYVPPPAARPAARASTPAFSPAPKIESRAPAPRVQSFTTTPAAKSSSKPSQSYAPAPSKQTLQPSKKK